MTTPTIKLPMQAALNASLDMIRQRADCTDAVVIIINQRTGETKVGSIRGEINHMTDLVGRVASALNKQRNLGRGIITI